MWVVGFLVISSVGLPSCGCWHWMALGVLGLYVDGVLQPSGQRCPRPFLASYHQLLNSKAYQFLITSGDLSLSIFGSCVERRDMVL